MKSDKLQTTEQPPREVTVNGHLYRLVGGDPIRGHVRRRADEIKAVMSQYGFDFNAARSVARP